VSRPCANVSSLATSLHNGSHGSFKPGDVVVHVRFGSGVIVSEWGSWQDKNPTDGHDLNVSGHNIYETRFEDETRSVSCSSLSLVEAAPAIHPFSQKFPPLSSEEYAALRESIAKNGQLVPIVVSSSGEIIDGAHRFRACISLGISPPEAQQAPSATG
jgi:hypothetical protein